MVFDCWCTLYPQQSQLTRMHKISCVPNTASYASKHYSCIRDMTENVFIFTWSTDCVPPGFSVSFLASCNPSPRWSICNRESGRLSPRTAPLARDCSWLIPRFRFPRHHGVVLFCILRRKFSDHWFVTCALVVLQAFTAGLSWKSNHVSTLIFIAFHLYQEKTLHVFTISQIQSCRMLSLYNVYVNSALLVLNGTSLKSNNALLARSWYAYLLSLLAVHNHIKILSSFYV